MPVAFGPLTVTAGTQANQNVPPGTGRLWVRNDSAFYLGVSLTATPPAVVTGVFSGEYQYVIPPWGQIDIDVLQTIRSQVSNNTGTFQGIVYLMPVDLSAALGLTGFQSLLRQVLLIAYDAAEATANITIAPRQFDTSAQPRVVSVPMTEQLAQTGYVGALTAFTTRVPIFTGIALQKTPPFTLTNYLFSIYVAPDTTAAGQQGNMQVLVVLDALSGGGAVLAESILCAGAVAYNGLAGITPYDETFTYPSMQTMVVPVNTASLAFQLFIGYHNTALSCAGLTISMQASIDQQQNGASPGTIGQFSSVGRF